MWQRYLVALKTSPILANGATALNITFFGDILAQNIEKKYSPEIEYAFNWERSLTVASYWTVASAPTVLWFRWLDGRFPIPKVNPRGLLTLAQKLTLHLGIFAPIINACFYGWLILKTRYFTINANGTSKSTFWENWSIKLEKDLWQTTKSSVALWGTAQTFNFLFLPTHTRVLFTSFVSVFWTAYVSVVGHQ